MDFRQAEEQFRILEQMMRSGQIAPDEYSERLGRLVVVDGQGARWQMQERTGKWFTRRGGQWQAADPHQAPPAAAPPLYTLPREPQPAAARPRSASRRHWLLAVGGLLAACLVCALVAGGAWLAYPYLQPQAAGLPAPLPLTLPGQPAEPTAPPQVSVLPAETTSVPAGGISRPDEHGVALAVPAEALAEGGQAQLSASTVSGGWAAALEKHYTIDTPFYSVAAQGQDDSSGRLSLTFSASSPDSRVLAVIDGEHLALLSTLPQNEQIKLELRAGPSETGESAAGDPVAADPVLYAVVTPRRPGANSVLDAPVSLRRQAADSRSCTPVLDAAYQLVSYCRQSPDGSIVVEVPGSQLDKLAQVDAMVDRVSEVMGKYAGLNFTAAKLSPGSPMIVRVFTGAGSPTYKPANGVLYMPIDSIASITSGTPHDLYHEIAHWIQDEEYFTIAAFYSGPKTWWLETAAENMVMLLDEGYAANNLTTYGTISHNGHQIAFQGSPNQWPGDFYVHAQLVKLNMCESEACPFSQAGFVEAINQGTYPLLDASKQALLSANLDDYARYLLGKTPLQANTAIRVAAPLATGDGYGEYVTLSSTRDKDFSFLANGAQPQMRQEADGAREVFVIEAGLEKDGVYPLAVRGAEAKYAAVPAKLTIQPGAPFWYTIDNGEPVFSDGSKEVIIQPIHIKMGVGLVRLVALGRSGGEVLRARIEPLDLSGSWVVFPEKQLSNNITCTGDTESETDPAAGSAQLSAVLVYLIGAMGEMQPEATGRGYDWSLVPVRLPPDVKANEFTFQAAALQKGDAVHYQAQLNLPQPESRRFPPGLGISMAAFIGPVFFIRRGRRRVLLALLAAGLLLTTLSGCSGGFSIFGTTSVDLALDSIKFIGGQDTATIQVSALPQGQPLWQMTGQATYNVNMTTSAWAVVMDESGETISVCTGTATYQVTTYVYKDVQIVLDEE